MLSVGDHVVAFGDEAFRSVLCMLEDPNPEDENLRKLLEIQLGKNTDQALLWIKHRLLDTRGIVRKVSLDKWEATVEFDHGPVVEVLEKLLRVSPRAFNTYAGDPVTLVATGNPDLDGRVGRVHSIVWPESSERSYRVTVPFGADPVDGTDLHLEVLVFEDMFETETSPQNVGSTLSTLQRLTEF